MNISAVTNPAAHFSAPTPPAPTSGRNQDQYELIQAVKAVNAAEAVGQDNEITFVVDRTTRRAVIRIVNRETGELVREIPSEYVRRLAEEVKLR